MRWMVNQNAGPATWERRIWESDKYDLHRSDGVYGALWTNIDNGDQIALVADGGWRMEKDGEEYPSQYRVFRYSQAGDSILEITDAFVEYRENLFDRQRTGATRYAEVLERLTKKISGILGAGTVETPL